MRKVLFFLSLSLVCCDTSSDKSPIKSVDNGVKNFEPPQREQTYRQERNSRCNVVENCLFGHSTDTLRILYVDDPPSWQEKHMFTEEKLKELKALPLSKWFIGFAPFGEAFCTKDEKGTTDNQDTAVCLSIRLLGDIKRGSICEVTMGGNRFTDYGKFGKFTDYNLYYGQYSCPYLTLYQYQGVERLFFKLYRVYVKSLDHSFREYVKRKNPADME